MNVPRFDTQFALHALWKYRTASMVCAIAVGLGIGVTNPSLSQQLGGQSARGDSHPQCLISLPRVQASSLSNSDPHFNSAAGVTDTFSIAGRAPAEHAKRLSALIKTVSPHYFDAMNIALREGRVFTGSDRESTLPVAIVNKTFAERYFPGENPLGHKVKTGPADGNAAWLTIAGVVDDAHQTWMNKEYLPTLYVLSCQAPQLYS